MLYSLGLLQSGVRQRAARAVYSSNVVFRQASQVSYYRNVTLIFAFCFLKRHFTTKSITGYFMCLNLCMKITSPIIQLQSNLVLYGLATEVLQDQRLAYIQEVKLFVES